MDKQNNSKSIGEVEYSEAVLKQIEKLMEELKTICGGNYQISHYPCSFSAEYIKYKKLKTKPIFEVCYYNDKYESLSKKNKRADEIIKDVEKLPGVVFAFFKTDR